MKWITEEYLQNPGHLIIAGQTGSGKSVLINHIVNDISTDDLVLIDTKLISLYKWRGKARKYVDTVDDAVYTLSEYVNVMMDRFDTIRGSGSNEWEGSAIYIIIDELADLILTRKKTALPLIVKIMMLGRASKVFIIAGTQFPSRHVLSSEIMGNAQYCIGLRCASVIESAQIIGDSGCEELPPHGLGIAKSPQGLKNIEIPMFDESEVVYPQVSVEAVRSVEKAQPEKVVYQKYEPPQRKRKKPKGMLKWCIGLGICTLLLIGTEYVLPFLLGSMVCGFIYAVR